MQLKSPSDTTETELYISNSKIAQPTFTLKNGKLTTQGINGKSYAGYLGYSITIFPPVLQKIVFGSGVPDFSDWWAAYTCDTKGSQYLELRHGRELAVDLAVEKVAEGQKIKGKPLAFEGTSSPVRLRIQSR